MARQRITTPSIKSPNHPLPSTFLHSYPLIKISVRFISVYAKPYNPVNQPSKAILSEYQTIALVTYCPYQTFQSGYWTYDQTLISGYLGYLAIWNMRFVITLGGLRHSLYTRRNFRLQVKESDLHYRFRKPLYVHYRNLNYSSTIPRISILKQLTDIAHVGHLKVC